MGVVSSFKYLGIAFSAATCLVGSAGPARSQLGQLALHNCRARCAELGIEAAAVRRQLFSITVDSMLSYGAEVWAPQLVAKAVASQDGSSHSKQKSCTSAFAAATWRPAVHTKPGGAHRAGRAPTMASVAFAGNAPVELRTGRTCRQPAAAGAGSQHWVGGCRPRRTDAGVTVLRSAAGCSAAAAGPQPEPAAPPPNWPRQACAGLEV